MRDNEMVTLAEQQVTVRGHYDVVVCGGGPAGIGAAVAAGRGGARTLLVESQCHVGGMATSIPLSCFCDSHGGPVFDEMVHRLMQMGAAEYVQNPRRYRPPGRIAYHAQSVKAVALKMIAEAGVDVLLGTTAESAWPADEAVAGVLVANKGGRSLMKSRVVVDATADADIAASGGARFLKGDPEDGRLQHVAFRLAISNVDAERYEREKPSDEEIIELLRAAQEDGLLHPPAGVFRLEPEIFPFDRRSGQLALGGWEIQGVDPTDPVAVSKTLVECQLAALELVQLCRAHLPGYEDCEIGAFPAALGTRESRRIVGQYLLTGEDVVGASKFDDAVAKAWFWIDLHDPPPGKSTPYSLEYVQAHRPPEGDWYEIPYRCLVPEKLRGLLVAGRCVSCDRRAQGSLRIMPTCMFIGTAAGTAAAMAVAQGVLPHELDGTEVGAAILGA